MAINTGKKVPREYWDIPREETDRKKEFLEHRFGKGAMVKKVDGEGWLVHIWEENGSHPSQGSHLSQGAKGAAPAPRREHQESDFPDMLDEYDQPPVKPQSGRATPRQVVLDLSQLAPGEQYHIHISVTRNQAPRSPKITLPEVNLPDDFSLEDERDDDEIPY